MNLLNKDQILAANDRKFDDVEVPEWGGTVRVGQLTAIQRDRWDSETYVNGQVVTDGMRARLTAMCVVDENGQPVFTAADVEALGQKSAVALNRVWTAAAKLNGMLPSSVDAIEKNSEAVQGGETSGV